MKKLLVSLFATLFLAFSFGALNASIIDNGVVVASNEKCGGAGACGGDKPRVTKCGADSNKTKPNGTTKCGGEKKPKSSGACGQGKCGSQ